MTSQLLQNASRIHRAMGFKKSRFFFLKYLALYPHSSRWVHFVGSLYERHLADEAPIEMVRTKLLRAYYSRKWNAKQRCSSLLSHYNFVESSFHPDVLCDMLAGSAIPLCSVTGKSQEVYVFSVSQHARYRAEGELTIFMQKSGDESALAALTFSFDTTQVQGLSLRIGGLQGPQAEDAKQKVIQATKDLSGLRPKSAVLEVFYAIANATGAVSLEAVGRQNHPLLNDGHAFLANNDTFWEEVEAKVNALGDFILPAVQPQRALEDVAAKKRKDWLARRDIRAALALEAEATVRSWKKSGLDATVTNSDMTSESASKTPPSHLSEAAE